MRQMIAGAMFLLVVGCQNAPSPETQFFMSCATYKEAATLVRNHLRDGGTLSPKAVEAVQAARRVWSKPCLDKTLVDQSVPGVQRALLGLITVARELGV